MSWFDSILYPIMWVVAWVMVFFQKMFTALGMSDTSGWPWALSIVGLTVLMRVLMIPLFVKQIKASRGMQLLGPEMRKIQDKYKNKKDPASRERMAQETMALYKKYNTNPFASCLPILAQSPIFFALFRVLYSLPQLADRTYARDSVGPIDHSLAIEISQAKIFGAPLSSWFLQDGSTISVKIVAAVLIVAMSATTFTTQRQLTRKNMPAAALEGPMAQTQNIMLYGLPLIFVVTGVNFPIGVLIYWTTTNVWSMGQQFIVIRNNPTPGSEADRARRERLAKKGIILEDEKPKVDTFEQKPSGQRIQPKRQTRQQRQASSASGSQPQKSQFNHTVGSKKNPPKDQKQNNQKEQK